MGSIKSSRQLKIMSKMPSIQTQNSEDELLDEYRFDYQKAKPNRFAAHNKTQS
jgi:hypothetical protein